LVFQRTPIFKAALLVQKSVSNWCPIQNGVITWKPANDINNEVAWIETPPTLSF
jgi:hypothetical protein